MNNVNERGFSLLASMGELSDALIAEASEPLAVTEPESHPIRKTAAGLLGLAAVLTLILIPTLIDWKKIGKGGRPPDAPESVTSETESVTEPETEPAETEKYDILTESKNLRQVISGIDSTFADQYPTKKQITIGFTDIEGEAVIPLPSRLYIALTVYGQTQSIGMEDLNGTEEPAVTQNGRLMVPTATGYYFFAEGGSYVQEREGDVFFLTIAEENGVLRFRDTAYNVKTVEDVFSRLISYLDAPEWEAVGTVTISEKGYPVKDIVKVTTLFNTPICMEALDAYRSDPAYWNGVLGCTSLGDLSAKNRRKALGIPDPAWEQPEERTVSLAGFKEAARALDSLISSGQTTKKTYRFTFTDAPGSVFLDYEYRYAVLSAYGKQTDLPLNGLIEEGTDRSFSLIDGSFLVCLESETVVLTEDTLKYYRQDGDWWDGFHFAAEDGFGNACTLRANRFRNADADRNDLLLSLLSINDVFEKRGTVGIGKDGTLTVTEDPDKTVLVSSVTSNTDAVAAFEDPDNRTHTYFADYYGADTLEALFRLNAEGKQAGKLLCQR
ncbi:MAG: hypothetical protein MJ070_02130 [Lachnospiraceae bacterium]|nr:hypothetical protein [Lachnospiraceae bacterium]